MSRLRHCNLQDSRLLAALYKQMGLKSVLDLASASRHYEQDVQVSLQLIADNKQQIQIHSMYVFQGFYKRVTDRQQGFPRKCFFSFSQKAKIRRKAKVRQKAEHFAKKFSSPRRFLRKCLRIFFFFSQKLLYFRENFYPLKIFSQNIL